MDRDELSATIVHDLSTLSDLAPPTVLVPAVAQAPPAPAPAPAVAPGAAPQRRPAATHRGRHAPIGRARCA